MKSSNTIVTIVVIAAVLVAAYAVGMLIHKARTGNSPSGAEANDVGQGTTMPYGPGTGRAQDSPEARAKLKEKRAEALEKLESATEEQKAQFREQVRERFSARPNQRPAPRRPAPQPQAPRTQPSTPDPNIEQNSERTGSEPNAAGQG